MSWQLGSQQDSRLCRRELQHIYGSLSCQKAERFLEMLEAEVEAEIPINPPPEFSPASWEQVRQLEGACIRFAPHTHSHRILSQLPEDQARFELSRSLEVINTETRFGIPVLAYPVGLPNCYGFREMRLAESIGFTGAFTACNGYSALAESKRISWPAL
jgi:peptidoglycan/xylan/chitin deacetylase (PgdA/CDA1 family)